MDTSNRSPLHPKRCSFEKGFTMMQIFLAALAYAALTFITPHIGGYSVVYAQEACVHPAVATVSNVDSLVQTNAMGTASPSQTSVIDAPRAESETAARIIAGIENFVACRNNGDFAAYAALLTTNRMLAEAGTTNPDDVVAGLEAFNLPITILSLGDVRMHPDGRLSADFVHLFGEHLYYRSRIYVIEQDGFVKFDEEQYLPEEIQGEQVVVDVGSIDFAFQLDQTTLTNAPYVILRGHNEGTVAHEMIVVRLPAGATVEQALSGQVSESQIDFIGQVTMAPGASDDLVLVNLDPGTYTLFCLIAEPDGTPHAAMGMVAQFTIDGISTPIDA